VDRTTRSITRGCAALAAAAGLCGLLGWCTGEVALERIFPHLATMKFTTACCLILLGAAWLVPRRPAGALRALAGVAAGLVVLEYALHTGLGIDQLVFTDHGSTAHPGRPALATALGILLLALAQLPRLADSRLGAFVALVVLIGATLPLLGFIYGVDALYEFQPYGSVAVHTAAALFLLALARLAAQREGGMRWVIEGRDQGSSLVRALLLLIFIAQPLIGWLALRIQARGWVVGSATIALIIVLCMVSIGVVGWVASFRLGRVDRDRMRALDDLTELAADLERQVDDRVDQIHRRHSEIAVLEDRQRIAADLHDVVIQRLFAAGLVLQAGVSDDAVGRLARMETASEEMDAAIKELRASIFELHGRGAAPAGVAASAATIVHDAARILGFEPDLTVQDPDGLTDEVADDLLAVLRESLANVARHARASSVSVVLRAEQGLVTLLVTDDGRGMGETRHRSGTRNIVRRAEARGGSCRWSPVEPHGTELLWSVPDREQGQLLGRPGG
jgi:signal transduction histidine kinase